MTKEQAVAILRNEKRLCKPYVKKKMGEDLVYEALEMAIKALEQQPSDCKIFGHKENCIGGTDCENCDYKIQALEQPTSNDCISRAEVDRLCFKYLKPNTDDNIAFYEHFCDLPPVTPAIPTSDDCVSRQALINNYNVIETPVGYRKVVDMQVVEDIPPVTPTFSKNATNGDVIRTMFQSLKIANDGLINDDLTGIMAFYGGYGSPLPRGNNYFNRKWWNAPYTEKGDNSNVSN